MKQLTASQRETFLISLVRNVLQGKLSEGEMLQMLRKKILGMNQDKYAKLVQISRRTLTSIEKNRGNQSTDVLNRVFRPFGLHVGIVPMKAATIEKLLSEAAVNTNT